MRTVLVTGVSRPLGGRMAARLAESGDLSVIGVDVVAPERAIEGITFVRADIRNPVIAKIMGEAAVDTVVHMGVISTPRQAGGRSTMKEINVIGTMQLLAACQRTPALRHVIVKSSAAVYGSGPKDPALFAENMEPKHRPSSGWAKDCVEVESYVRGFARRRADVTVTTLRLANVIGPGVQTGVTSYFCLPVVPTVLGFDPRLQFTHVTDALGAIASAVDRPVDGTFNIGGEGVILLSQALRMLGRSSVAVPAPLLPYFGRVVNPSGLADFSSEVVRWLSYGRALDTSASRTELGFVPRWSTIEAFADFAAAQHRGGTVTDDEGEVQRVDHT